MQRHREHGALGGTHASLALGAGIEEACEMRSGGPLRDGERA